MPARAERSRRRLAGRAIVAVLAVLVALPGYLGLSPSWRPIVVRLACAAVVAVGCVRARRWVRDAMSPPAVSVLDAPPPARPAGEVDARFRGLHDDLVFSTRSQRYFDAILWPRLSALAGADLPRPPERPGRRRRGPSLRTLEALVAEVERRA
jgi:hypothetical protein